MNPRHFSWQKDVLILRCYFQPSAAKDEIVGLHGDRLKLRITAPPVDGKANAHILKWFSALFKVPKTNIAITQGELGRQKTVHIISPNALPKDALLDVNITH